MTLPGPSRRIIVQPLEAPAVPDERDPVAEPGLPAHAPRPEPVPASPEREPEPVREPVPEREPVPVP
jgi:hypothetical protein